MSHSSAIASVTAASALALLVAACSSGDHGGGPDAATGTGGSSTGNGGANSGGAAGASVAGKTGSSGNAGASGGATGSGGVTTGGTSSTSGGASSGGANGSGGANNGGSGGHVTDAGTAGASAGGAEPTDGGRSFSTDRTKFFGDSRCAAAGLQFCDDFESGSLAAYTLSGKPTIDGVQKARGQKALHIKVASGGKMAIETSKLFPETDNVYYGRTFVYFAALPTPVGATNYAHWTFIAATGDNVSGEIRLSGQMQTGINHFGVGTDNRTDANGTGDWTNSDNDPKGAPKTVPLNQWLCIEWLHDGAKNETRFYWDDTEHPSLLTTSSQHGGNKVPYILPNFRRVWFGFQEYQAINGTDGNPEQYELWMDEIALDHDRIGCVL
ncbi:MAG TPA: hypothetical protein VH062_25110 [Polyangiaceae bacterium]|jgi:hypothetical protein|nr:hypothetical protein [Polyangiaceae bacterium]